MEKGQRSLVRAVLEIIDGGTLGRSELVACSLALPVQMLKNLSRAVVDRCWLDDVDARSRRPFLCHGPALRLPMAQQLVLTSELRFRAKILNLRAVNAP